MAGLLPTLLHSHPDVVDEVDAAERMKMTCYQTTQQRRGSIFGQRITEQQMNSYRRPVHAKDADMRAMIRETLRKNEKMQVLVGHLSEESLDNVIDAFYTKHFQDTVDIIRQGDTGDCLYIIASGCVDIFVARPGADGRLKEDDRGSKVVTFETGALFGELALMHNESRAATVTAIGSVSTFVLDTTDFKMLLMQQGQAQYAKYEGWLARVDLFKTLNHYELTQLADVMESVTFAAGQEIIRQGDFGDKFYILEHGSAAAYIDGEGGEKEVKVYEHQGEYFGEIALLTSEQRKATVRATGNGCSAARLSAEDFTALLGPITDILSAHIHKYPQYSQFLR